MLSRAGPAQTYRGGDPRASRIAALWECAVARARVLEAADEPTAVAVETPRGNVVIVRDGDRLAAALCSRGTAVNAARYALQRALLA